LSEEVTVVPSGHLASVRVVLDCLFVTSIERSVPDVTDCRADEIRISDVERILWERS